MTQRRSPRSISISTKARSIVGRIAGRSSISRIGLCLCACIAALSWAETARAQPPQACASLPAALTGTETSLKDLTDFYDQKRDEAKKGADWRPLKQALTDCVLDLVFADFAKDGKPGQGRLGHVPRTTALLRFLDYVKGGWTGSGVRGEMLKQFGKQARQANRKEAAFVFDIDRAIANGPEGLKQVVAVDPGKTYEEKVKDKIASLTAIMEGGDYRGGPLEVLVQDLLAVAFEESAMLAATATVPDDARAVEQLKRAIGHLDAALAIATPGSPANRAVVNRRDIGFFDNDFRFRLALLRLLVDESDWETHLSAILTDAATWDETRDLDHIYVRTFIRWPPQDAYVSGTATGSVRVSLPKNAFYNPGQIALYLCGAQIPPGGISARAQALDNHLDAFVNRDYRVVISASRDVSQGSRDRLAQLAAKNNAKLKDAWSKLVDELEGISPGFASGKTAIETTMMRGAQRCEVSKDRLAAIYGGFAPEVRATWETDKSDKVRAYGIYVGGFLSRNEAQLLAERLSRLIDVEEEPYVARPKING
jgi:hypothetical protein